MKRKLEEDKDKQVDQDVLQALEHQIVTNGLKMLTTNVTCTWKRDGSRLQMQTGPFNGRFQWSDLSAFLTSLNESPFTILHHPETKCVFHSNRQTQVEINWWEPTMELDMEYAAMARLLQYMKIQSKVPVKRITDILCPKSNPIAECKFKISVQDQIRLFNICAVLYKLQGTDTLAAMEVKIDEGDNDTYHIAVSGLNEIHSSELFMLLNPFCVEIDQVRIGWGEGDSPVVLLISVWKSTVAISSIWLSPALVQTPPGDFDVVSSKRRKLENGTT